MAEKKSLFPKIKKEISDFMFEEEGNIPRNKLLGLSSMILLLSLLYATDAFAGHRSHSSHQSHSSHRSSGGGHSSHYSHSSHSNHGNTHYSHSNHSSHTSHTSHGSHIAHANYPGHSNTITATAAPVTHQNVTAAPKPTATPKPTEEIITIPSIQKPQPNDFTMPEIKTIELTTIPNNVNSEKS